MQGITHLYRQHAIDKQVSLDSWRNGYNQNNLSSACKDMRLNSDSSTSSSDSSSNKSGTPWSHGKISKANLYNFVCLILLEHQSFFIPK